VKKAGAMSSQTFVVDGGHPLRGEVQPQRAKNAILPMIAAALLPEDGQTVLHDVPEIEDVKVALALAEAAGAQVQADWSSGTIVIDASTLRTGELPLALTSRLRGSLLFLAPLLARMGFVSLPGSGGCDLGTRRVDFHHRGFARLGADVRYSDDGGTVIRLDRPALAGNFIYLDFPSHTGTENLMMGAALATGTTMIENASVEPEVLDFGAFLIRMGAEIKGLGTPTLVIEGVPRLHAIEYTAIPDRLVTGTLMMAAAITGGDVTFTGTRPDHLRLVIAKLDQMGVSVDLEGDSLHVYRRSGRALTPINITTHPHPGFPTDLQPCIAALSTIAAGTSYIRERIFESRYDFVDGLIQMGADILISQSDVCIIHGVSGLQAADVRAESIRAGAAVLLGALAAEGTSVIHNAYQIDRGYAGFDTLLAGLGASIRREAETHPSAIRPG
jgi:UDP-N-acetylglucosamine 1-carboxyvinyltransferase